MKLHMGTLAVCLGFIVACPTDHTHEFFFKENPQKSTFSPNLQVSSENWLFSRHLQGHAEVFLIMQYHVYVYKTPILS